MKSVWMWVTQWVTSVLPGHTVEKVTGNRYPNGWALIRMKRALRGVNNLTYTFIGYGLLVTRVLNSFRPGETQVTHRKAIGYLSHGDQQVCLGNPGFWPILIFGVTLQFPRNMFTLHTRKLLAICGFCTVLETSSGGKPFTHLAYTRARGGWRVIIGDMAVRNPFMYDRDPQDRDTEFGFGAGKFADPNIDYSDGGVISGIPIADPDREAQLLQLAMIKRMDLADPSDQPSPYVAGNTDRYGAQPPLVRERKRPKYTRPQQEPPSRMKRAW